MLVSVQFSVEYLVGGRTVGRGAFAAMGMAAEMCETGGECEEEI